MKSHYFEEADEAAGHRETAADACVREHQAPTVSGKWELIAGGAAIAMLLALATLSFAPGREATGAAVRARAPVPQWRIVAEPWATPQAPEALDDDEPDAQPRTRGLADGDCCRRRPVPRRSVEPMI